MSEQPKSGDEIRITATKGYGSFRVGDVLIVAHSWIINSCDSPIVFVRALMKGRKSLSILKGHYFEWEIINRFNQ